MDKRHRLVLFITFFLILRAVTYGQMSDSSPIDPYTPRFLTTQVDMRHPDPTYLLNLEKWRSKRAEELALKNGRIHNLRWYAPDLHYRIVARWIPSGMAGNLALPHTHGEISDESTPGMAEFSIYGQVVHLFPIQKAPGSLFFIFRDATANSSTYKGGRYLFTELPDHGVARSGTLVLDFNRAENPPCAYQADADCPLSPQQNRLTIPIPAGEKYNR